MLYKQNISCGEFLFRWRTFLPLVMIPPFLFAFEGLQYWNGSHSAQHLWALSCMAISLIGAAIRITAVAFVPARTSGRNCKRQVADHLNTTGMYSVCRNPLYLGNLLIWIGVILYPRDFAFLTIFLLAYWLYYERIISAEEAFLEKKFDQTYTSWCEKTPAFIPDFRLWRSSSRKWSWKMILRREYTTLWLIVFAFFAMDVGAHLVVERRFFIDSIWALQLTLGTVVYLGVRYLKKRSLVLATT